MDLLGIAVVDITTLVASCHALKSGPLPDGPASQRKLRNRLRRELKRGTLAYIDALARTRRVAVDDPLLLACRKAAERQMAHAIARQQWLRDIMVAEPGALEGFAIARQDLWRLAHMAAYLRIGMAAWHDVGNPVDAKPAEAMADRLRRRLRKAMIAYARATLRAKGSRTQQITTARAAALAAIGKRGAAEAEGLSHIEAGGGAADAFLRQGVTKALFDLGLDWQRPG